ncbi:hypothetical protein ACJMK2_026675 [Sinanodonta woodiana]|uniref:Uncharacterized protein n=1 Tax=Sinanodonta woodiana TaxID=1069815 RepID=A0ABD3XM76_SINWO
MSQFAVPPKILDNTPTSFHQPQGTEVRLFCTGTGSPKPTITWTKDEVPLRTSQRIVLRNDDSEVIIHNLHEDDGGIYKCRFKNAVGQMTQSIHLIVEGQAYIIQPPVNRTAVLGQRIQFTCLAEGYPNNITYRWYKDNRNVNTLPGYLSRFIIFADGSLIITMVDKVDMGWYTCRPSNGMGQDPEATAYLNVTYSPEVLKNKMTQHLIWALGFFEKLDCPVDANPPVYQFVWTKNGQIVDFAPSKLTLALNGSLLINKVEESDAGNYRCTAISSVGRGESDIVQVEVKDPPHFTVRPDSQYIRQLAQTVIMPCAAIGTPAPTITWRKVGGSLEFDDRIQKLHGNLTINSLQKDDYGIYECEAANEVRKIITSTELIIQNTTPYAPYNVSVSTQLFSATVRWIPAYSSTPQHYLIWFRSVNGEISQWQTMMVEPQNATRFTLYNLEPDTTYEFMVLSRNNLGDGQYSEKVRAKTLGYTDDMATALPTDSSGNFYIPPIVKPLGPRPSPPRNLSVSGDPLGIVLSWLPPENTSVPIFYYTVEYRTDGDWVSEQSNVLHPNTSYILKPVLAGKTYQFRVISYGVLAYSYPSEYIAFTVPPEEGFRLSEAEIGGIVGGLLFLIIAVTLAVIAVICSRRRDRKQAARYGNVKYRGPADDVDSHKPEHTPKRSFISQDPRGYFIRPPSETGYDGIFVLPHTKDMYTGFLRDPRIQDHGTLLYDTDKGYKVPHTPQSTSHSLTNIPESSQLSAFTKYSHQSDAVVEENGFIQRDDLCVSRHSTKSSRSKGRQKIKSPPKDMDIEGSDDNGFLSDTVRRRNPGSHQDTFDRSKLVRSTRKQTPVLSPVPQDRQLPHSSFFGDEDDEVFVPPSQEKPGFPRHSSMKPGRQTYLTETFDSSGRLLSMNDISSVLPSFSEFSPHSLHQPSSSSLSSRYHPYVNISDIQHMPAFHYPDTLRSDQSFPSSLHSTKRQPSYHSHSTMDDTVIPQRSSASTIRPQRVISNDSNSSDSSGQPMMYTRDKLQGAVNRVRKFPRIRQSRGLQGSAAELDSILENPDSHFTFQGYNNQTLTPEPSTLLTVRDYPSGYPYKGQYRSSDSRGSVSSSGLGSLSGRNRTHDSRSNTRDDFTPDSVSSGIGSRNTSSQLTGSSVHSRPSQTSQSSFMLSPDYDARLDSLPYFDSNGGQRRDISGDENYEFDSLNALESDLLDALHNYSQVNQDFNFSPQAANTSEGLSGLYPKPRFPSRYSDSEQRFEKLREEFQRYRQKQRERQGEGHRIFSMDSEML